MNINCETLNTSTIITSAERTTSAADLRMRAARAATGFDAEGAVEGGAIAIMLRNDFPFLECILAANMIGAYAVPINWHYRHDEVRYMLTDSAATHLVVHADLLPEVAAAIPSHVRVLCVPTPDEVARAYNIPEARCLPPESSREWYQWLHEHAAWSKPSRLARGRMNYTSGTTGRPKGVRRAPPKPEDRERHARLNLDWFGMRPGMSTAMIGPLYHSVQSTYAQSAVRAGGQVHLAPRFDAEEVLHLIEHRRITHLHLVPVMMRRLLQLPDHVKTRYDLSSLEFVVHGAAPCSPEVKRAMIDWWGPILHEYYGTTEAGMVSRASSEEWLTRPGTVGRAWPGREIRICDAEGSVLPARREGHVYMSLGLVPDFTYHNASEARTRAEREGFITSGDIGYLDEDGYLFLCDRAHDVVISGGANIYPAEIEGVLVSHPDVHDCAVFGVPDEEFGESLMAVVQLRQGSNVSKDTLSFFLASKLAKFKVPRSFEFRDTLPREDSGKIFKRALRNDYWAQTGRRI